MTRRASTWDCESLGPKAEACDMFWGEDTEFSFSISCKLGLASRRLGTSGAGKRGLTNRRNRELEDTRWREVQSIAHRKSVVRTKQGQGPDPPFGNIGVDSNGISKG